MPATTEEKTMTFDAFEFDVDTQEQNCAEGKYSVEISSVKLNVIDDKDDGSRRPQLLVSFRTTATEEESDAHQQSIGALVSDRFTMYPNGNRKGRFVKERLRTLLDKLGIDHATLPSAPQTASDYDEIIAAMTGGTLDEAWVTHSKVVSKDDPNTFRVFENIQYTAPRGGRANPDADEVQASGKGKKPMGKTPAKKVSKRN